MLRVIIFFCFLFSDDEVDSTTTEDIDIGDFDENFINDEEEE